MSDTKHEMRVAVDCVIFGYRDKNMQILLIQRGIDPFKGCWALPGGFVLPHESLEDAAKRELQEETGMESVFMEQLYSFGAVNRDPRTRVISIVYYALIPLIGDPKASSDAAHAQWVPIEDMPDLAFDHAKIVEMALNRVRGKVRYQPVGFELLPKKFTLTQLQRLYETILGRPLDKRNFRKKLQKLDILIQTDEREVGVSHRAAYFWRFDKDKYENKVKNGFHFEL